MASPRRRKVPLRIKLVLAAIFSVCPEDDDGNAADRQFGIAPGAPEGTMQLWAWGPLKQRPEDVQAAMRMQAPTG